MPDPLCVDCQTLGRLIEASRSARVDYYRCDQCGHVWSQHKSDPIAPAKSTMNRNIARVIRNFLGL